MCFRLRKPKYIEFRLKKYVPSKYQITKWRNYKTALYVVYHVSKFTYSCLGQAEIDGFSFF